MNEENDIASCLTFVFIHTGDDFEVLKLLTNTWLVVSQQQFLSFRDR